MSQENIPNKPEKTEENERSVKRSGKAEDTDEPAPMSNSVINNPPANYPFWDGGLTPDINRSVAQPQSQCMNQMNENGLQEPMTRNISTIQQPLSDQQPYPIYNPNQMSSSQVNYQQMPQLNQNTNQSIYWNSNSPTSYARECRQQPMNNQQQQMNNQQPMNYQQQQPMNYAQQPMNYGQQPMSYPQPPMNYQQQPMYNQEPQYQSGGFQLPQQNQQMSSSDNPQSMPYQSPSMLQIPQVCPNTNPQVQLPQPQIRQSNYVYAQQTVSYSQQPKLEGYLPSSQSVIVNSGPIFSRPIFSRPPCYLCNNTGINRFGVPCICLQLPSQPLVYPHISSYNYNYYY